MKLYVLFFLVILPACIHKDESHKKQDICIQSQDTPEVLDKTSSSGFIKPSPAARHIPTSKNDILPEALTSRSESIDVLRARLTDIPSIVGSSLKDLVMDDHNNKRLLFAGPSFSEQLIIMIKEDFSSRGWKLTQLYADKTYALIQAKKPYKIALITVQAVPSTWLAAASSSIVIIINETVSHENDSL